MSRIRILTLAAVGVLAAVVPLSPAAAGPPPANDTNFTLAVDRSDDTVVPGTETSVRVHLVVPGLTGNFANNIALAATGLPAGVTATFVDNPMPAKFGARTSSLHLTTSATSPLGRFTIAIQGTSVPNAPNQPSGFSTTTFQLILAAVDAPPTDGNAFKFTLLSGRSSGTAIVGGGNFDTAAGSYYLERASSFTDSIRLTASDVPAGVTVNLVNGTQTSQLRLTPSASSPVGTFPVTVIATSFPTHGNTVYTAKLRFWFTIAAAPGFALSLSAPAGTVARGGAEVSTQLRQSAIEGFADNATLAVSGLPAGVTAALSATQITSSQPSTLVLSAAPNGPTGTFGVTITATSVFASQLVETVVYQLTITATPGFTIALEPEFGFVSPGGTIATSLTMQAVNGFNGPAHLRVTGLPTGVTALPGSAEITPTQPVTLTLSTSADSPAGTFFVSVEASDKPQGPPRQIVTYQLTIGDPSA